MNRLDGIKITSACLSYQEEPILAQVVMRWPDKGTLKIRWFHGHDCKAREAEVAESSVEKYDPGKGTKRGDSLYLAALLAMEEDEGRHARGFDARDAQKCKEALLEGARRPSGSQTRIPIRGSGMCVCLPSSRRSIADALGK